MKIIFIGTPEFGAIILEKLIKSGHKPFLVITAPDKPVGRKQILTPTPVKVVAQKYNILIVQPEKIAQGKEEVERLKPDLIILASYGQIIPKDILDIPQHGFLNVHPSLLPKYRGASPIQYAILNGDEKTGVTIIRMTEKVDEGPILSQKEIKIDQKEKFELLHDKLAEMGAKLLIETLPKLFAGKICPQVQDDLKATYTKTFEKEDGHINWHKPAKEIEGQVRALNPWPGTFAKVQSPKFKVQNENLKFKILKIIESGISPIQTEKQVGEVFLTKDGKLAVQCGQKSLILQKLQLEGGKPMSTEEFLRGHRNIVGTTLQ